jgi:hypothetical protein
MGFDPAGLAALAGADPFARSAALLALQPAVGNAAIGRALARQPVEAPPAPTGDSPAAPAAPTGDVLTDALTELRASTETIDRNTAEAVDSGVMRVMYIQDLRTDPASDSLLDAWGHDKTQFVVLLSPGGEQMVVQRNAQGTVHHENGQAWLFASNAVSVARMRSIIVHEANHAMRLDEGSHDAADSLDRYKDEFQAYWVAEFRDVADLDDRARQIRAHILRDYPVLSARYNSDEDFKALVDAHTRPDANVLNSLRWRAVEEAAAGIGTDEDAIFAAIRSMSAAEKAAARGDPNFVAILQDELSGDELARAMLLLAGTSGHMERAIDAMSGLGTDEDALFAALEAMDAAEKAIVRGDAPFMELIYDELSGSELQRALTILGGG